MNVSLCNELFHTVLPLEELMVRCVEMGVQGIEIAPETVFASGGKPSRREVQRLRRVFTEYGSRFCAFHWLLRHDSSLRLITDRRPADSAAWQSILRLSDAAAEMGGGVLVLGSGEQRSYPAAVSGDEAMAMFQDGVTYVAGRLAPNVTIGIEPLPSARTNLLNSIEDTWRFVSTINGHNVGLVYDLRSAAHETPPAWNSPVAPWASFCHVHVQDKSGALPHPRSSGLTETLNALQESKYEGWISIEPFSIDTNVDIALTVIQHTVAWMRSQT